MSNLRVAVLVSDGFEESEFNSSVDELIDAGVQIEILAENREQFKLGIRGMNGLHPARYVQPKALVQDADPSQYDAVLVPGGALSADRLRASRFYLGFVQNLFDAGKPVGVIGHGAWLLADSAVAQGKTIATLPSIHKDLERAGAVYKDQPIAIDENLITCRAPIDVPEFIHVFMDKLKVSAQVHFKAA